ncbi:MAG: acyl carrier protein [Candidatus Aminicenantes bacterium]|nr:acyl carrier protein [Candidatus Aminicenantes bacterium]
MNEDEIKKKLKTYICHEIIKNKDYPLRDDEPLITGGLIDSFSLVHIAVFIEKEMGIQIPDTDFTIENMDTVNDMTKRILKEFV